MKKQLEKATFAGGCFWCMVKPFDQQPGIESVTSGYTGGHTVNPTYEQVCTNLTGHTEAVQIVFDPSIVSYDELLTTYWQQVDPTDASGQFHDRGSSYRPVIFYHSEEQKQAALQSKKALEESRKFHSPIVVKIEAASTFYEAETYHQDYYKKNALHYGAYHVGSGRAGFIKKHWGE